MKAPGSPRGRAGLEYLGEDVAAYKQVYEIKTSDDSDAWAALMRLCRVLNTTPADRLEAALAPILDIDATLKFMAVEIAMANPDGYWTRANAGFAAGVADAGNPLKAFIDARRAYLLQVTAP